MLKLFKTQIAIFPLTIIVVLMGFFRINVFLQKISINHWEGDLAPFSQVLKSLLGSLLTHNLWFNLLATAILVFIQASITVTILNYFKVDVLKGFLVAWLYVLILHLFPAFVFVSPELIAVTFILTAFKIFIFIDDSRFKLKQVFTGGILLGLATAFWFPSIFFFPVAISALARANFFSLRSFLGLLIAFSIPFLYVFTFLYLINRPLSIQGLHLNHFKLEFYNPKEYLSLYVLILILISSFPMMMKFLNKLLKKPKDFFKIMNLYVLCIIVLFFFQNQNSVNILILLVFPISITLTVYFNRIKRNFVAEALHLVLLLSVVVNFIYFLK